MELASIRDSLLGFKSYFTAFRQGFKLGRVEVVKTCFARRYFKVKIIFIVVRVMCFSVWLL